jgi:hypothetical protein
VGREQDGKDKHMKREKNKEDQTGRLKQNSLHFKEKQSLLKEGSVVM